MICSREHVFYGLVFQAAKATAAAGTKKPGLSPFERRTTAKHRQPKVYTCYILEICRLFWMAYVSCPVITALRPSNHMSPSQVAICWSRTHVQRASTCTGDAYVRLLCYSYACLPVFPFTFLDFLYLRRLSLRACACYVRDDDLHAASHTNEHTVYQPVYTCTTYVRTLACMRAVPDVRQNFSWLTLYVLATRACMSAQRRRV